MGDGARRIGIEFDTLVDILPRSAYGGVVPEVRTV
jgi:hypothetical protein